MMIRLGTNRVVILIGKYAYKFPRGKKGRYANDAEYRNSNNNHYVARTKKHRWFLKQERLENLRCFSLDTKPEDIPDELKPLFSHKLHNRFQVGQDRDGNWKFYDYEDIKYYTKGRNSK